MKKNTEKKSFGWITKDRYFRRRGWGYKRIARQVGVSVTTVRRYLGLLDKGTLKPQSEKAPPTLSIEIT